MPTNSPPSTPRSFSPCSPWSTRMPSLPLWRTICSSTSPLSPSLSIPSRSPLKTFLIVFRISLLSSLVVSTLLDKQPEDLSLQLVPVYGFLTNTSPILCSIVFTRYSTSSAAISVATTIPTFLTPPSQTGNTKSKDRVSLLFYLLRLLRFLWHSVCSVLFTASRTNTHPDPQLWAVPCLTQCPAHKNAITVPSGTCASPLCQNAPLTSPVTVRVRTVPHKHSKHKISIVMTTCHQLHLPWQILSVASFADQHLIGWIKLSFNTSPNLS